MDKKKLLDLKQQIEKAKTKNAELKGKQKTLMGQLKKDWGCKTIKQAKDKLTTLENDISDLEYKKEQGIKELEQQFEL